jgi:hypothetical protein
MKHLAPIKPNEPYEHRLTLWRELTAEIAEDCQTLFVRLSGRQINPVKQLKLDISLTALDQTLALICELLGEISKDKR